MSEERIGQLSDVREPLERAQLAAAEVEQHRYWMSRFANLRAQALLEAVEAGTTVTRLAEQLGVTRQQVHRLIRDARGTAYTGPPVPEN